MKKLITLIGIVLLSCLLLTSCGTYLPDYITFWKELSPSGTIEWDYDDNGIIYNGTKYVNTENYNGKISTDYDSEHCVKIATMPYSYLLGAVSVFYGNELENPDIISCNRGHDVYVNCRETGKWKEMSLERYSGARS